MLRSSSVSIVSIGAGQFFSVINASIERLYWTSGMIRSDRCSLFAQPSMIWCCTRAHHANAHWPAQWLGRTAFGGVYIWIKIACLFVINGQWRDEALRRKAAAVRHSWVHPGAATASCIAPCMSASTLLVARFCCGCCHYINFACFPLSPSSLRGCHYLFALPCESNP